jgi:hypothetical protein
MDDTDPLDPAEAISEMIRMLASGGPQQAQVLLSACRACRNRLLYLLDTAHYRGTFNRAVLARLRALPVNHQSHGDLSGPDWRKPEIRWIAQPGSSGSLKEQIEESWDALRGEIIAYLENHGSASERQIAEAAGIRWTVVSAQCRDLADRDLLRFDAASGEYSLATRPGSSGRPEVPGAQGPAGLAGATDAEVLYAAERLMYRYQGTMSGQVTQAVTTRIRQAAALAAERGEPSPAELSRRYREKYGGIS